jgi:hypothetical protein
MKVVSINILDNRMTQITVAKRFLIFFWRYVVYRSYDVKIPFEEWHWLNVTKSAQKNDFVFVIEPSEYWELNEWTRGDRI